jgi:hypothetical protein
MKSAHAEQNRQRHAMEYVVMTFRAQPMECRDSNIAEDIQFYGLDSIYPSNNYLIF